MPESLHLFVTVAGAVISGLLGINIFFVREFMRRMERSIDALTESITEHGHRLVDIDKNMTEKISRLDERILELDRTKKRSPRP